MAPSRAIPNSSSASKDRDESSRFSYETIYHAYTRPGLDAQTEHGKRTAKARIRDIERRLRLDSKAATKTKSEEDSGKSKVRLPAGKRIDYERELNQRQREDAIKAAEGRRLAVMKRYKKVKFFEGRKAVRRLKSARKVLAAAKDDRERESLRKAVHIAEVDKNYVDYCPLGWKYVSLYASGVDDDDDERPVKGDSEMWHRVEKAMDNGTLDQLKHEMTIAIPNRQQDLRKNEAENGEDEDEDSDGFFE